MTRWRYKVLLFPSPGKMIATTHDVAAAQEAALNQAGADGWELVAVREGFFYLRRSDPE